MNAIDDTIRHRLISKDLHVVSDDVGRFHVVSGPTTDSAAAEFRSNGYPILENLARDVHRYRRQARQGTLDYVILVPTLRCNLSCTYCQVSRVNETVHGYDWTEETLQDVLDFLGGLKAETIKIEFQGGEPLLRVDLLDAVRSFCLERFRDSNFVVCTNLQHLSVEARRFLAHPDVHISTSLDGDRYTHERQRTKSSKATDRFFDNLHSILAQYGNEKISALPTIDYHHPPDYDALLQSFDDIGIQSIYLRPINHQGFARKAHNDLLDDVDGWLDFYLGFIDFLIERNAELGTARYGEFYFSLCLRRVLAPGNDNHVDLRNPNPLGTDYLVIDYDGVIYPTDEARMVTRIGLIDLSIGHVTSGLEREKIDQLNTYASNEVFSECNSCSYQAWCGVDIVDDLSRYGRIDHPKHDTWFCRFHMALFDRIVAMLADDDPAVRLSMNGWAGAFGKATRLAVAR